MTKIKSSIFSIMIVLISHFSYSQYWVEDTTGIMQLSGGNNNVKSFKCINGLLYVGGAFFETGGIYNLNIAIWTDTTWLSIDGGITSGGVLCMEHYYGELYAGGAFQDAGGMPNTENLAAWNDTVWQEVGNLGNINSEVMAMEEYQGKLFVGGAFSGFGSTYWTHPYIAAWDGTSWLNVGEHQSTVYDLEVMNGDLYATSYDKVKKYKGGIEWETVGTANFYTDELMVDTINNFLYATGDFNYLNNVLCDGIAYWDGFEWHGILEGQGNQFANITSATIYRGYIYVGMVLDSLNGKKLNYIARWNGSQWDSLMCGLNNPVLTLQTYKDHLYVGGYFTEAGGYTAKGIARWYAPQNTSCDYLKPIAETVMDTIPQYYDSIAVEFYNNNPYVQSWLWDFNDGETDTVRLPVHYYKAPGIYNVCVTVNDTGCVKTACKTIVIDDKTGIEELDKITFKLYPNPSDGNFYAEVDYTHASGDARERAVSIKITGLNGHNKTTIPVTSEKTLINTTGWAKGTYVCNLFVDGKMVRSEKMVLK